MVKVPSAPFEPLHLRGTSITLDVSADTFVIPTDNLYALLYNNQWALAPGRVPLANGTYTFVDNQDNDTGLQNMIYPWVACFDSTGREIDFFLFTYRPKNLIYTVSSGIINTLTIYPGNGSVYHGRITHSNLTLDSNHDLIPDCLEPDFIGSVAYFLQSCGFMDTLIAPVIQTTQFLTADGKQFLTADGKQFLVRT